MRDREPSREDLVLTFEMIAVAVFCMFLLVKILKLAGLLPVLDNELAKPMFWATSLLIGWGFARRWRAAKC